MTGEEDLSAYFLHLRHGKYMGEVTAVFSLLVIPQVCRIGLFVTRCYCFQCGGCLTFFKTVINPQTRHDDACLTFADSGGSGRRLKVVFCIGKSRLLETQTSKRGEKRQTIILMNPRTWPSMVINPPMY